MTKLENTNNIIKFKVLYHDTIYTKVFNLRLNTLVLAINSLSEKDKENVGALRQIIDRAKSFEDYLLEAKKSKE